MFLSSLISKEDLTPTSVNTKATVTLETLNDGPKITSINLDCEADVPNLSEDKFQELVEKAKNNCPISKLYQGTTITVSASLKSAIEAN